MRNEYLVNAPRTTFPNYRHGGGVLDTMQASLHQRLLEYLKGVWQKLSEADNIAVPKWIFIIFLTALLGGGGTLFWRLFDRMDEQKAVSIRTEASAEALREIVLEKIKPIERQGLLTEEHQRAAEIKHAEDLAEIKGIMRAKNIQ